jgi:hypothetical protein
MSAPRLIVERPSDFATNAGLTAGEVAGTRRGAYKASAWFVSVLTPG